MSSTAHVLVCWFIFHLSQIVTDRIINCMIEYPNPFTSPRFGGVGGKASSKGVISCVRHSDVCRLHTPH